MAVFRVEKKTNYTVMSNHHLRNTSLSLKAKGLLSLILSLPEDWDYTIRGLAQICKDGVDSIAAGVKELEEQGYIIRQRVRNDKGQLLHMEYVVLEEPKMDLPILENPVQVNPIQEKPVQAKPVQDSPALEKRPQLNTYISNTQESNKELSINPSINDRSAMEEQVKDNICYDALCHDFNPKQVDEIVMLITDTLCSGPECIRIGKEQYPAEVVKDRLRSLNQYHIVYVFEALQQVSSEIHDIRSYLLRTLFNAPTTINHYYEAQAKHDLYHELE